MMLVTAIVAPTTVADVRAGLDRIDVPGVTISDVSGVGRGAVDRDADRRVDLVPRVRVEVMTEDESVEDVVATLAAALTDRHGDGKVWVIPIEQIVRVRTGERGADAL